MYYDQHLQIQGNSEMIICICTSFVRSIFGTKVPFLARMDQKLKTVRIRHFFMNPRKHGAPLA